MPGNARTFPETTPDGIMGALTEPRAEGFKMRCINTDCPMWTDGDCKSRLFKMGCIDRILSPEHAAKPPYSGGSVECVVGAASSGTDNASTEVNARIGASSLLRAGPNTRI